MSAPAFGNPIRGRIGPYQGDPDPESGFRVTRPFADESMPQYGPHDGLDIGNGQSGADILAMAEGEVYQAFWDSASGGAGIVRIDHGGGWSTGYAHMNVIRVTAGQRVSKGAHIADLDTTGWASGAHLHYDVTEGAERRDPWPYCNLDFSSEGIGMGTAYKTSEFEPITNRRFLTLAGARFRADTTTEAEVYTEFPAGQLIVPHAIVQGQNVNGSTDWYLAWAYADGKYREGALHESTIEGDGKFD